MPSGIVYSQHVVPIPTLHTLAPTHNAHNHQRTDALTRVRRIVEGMPRSIRWREQSCSRQLVAGWQTEFATQRKLIDTAVWAFQSTDNDQIPYQILRGHTIPWHCDRVYRRCTRNQSDMAQPNNPLIPGDRVARARQVNGTVAKFGTLSEPTWNMHRNQRTLTFCRMWWNRC